MIINGVEDADHGAELPPNYHILANSRDFGFEDGNHNPHPYFICDEGWPSERDAIEAAWKFHSRMVRVNMGVIKVEPWKEIR